MTQGKEFVEREPRKVRAWQVGSFQAAPDWIACLEYNEEDGTYSFEPAFDAEYPTTYTVKKGDWVVLKHTTIDIYTEERFKKEFEPTDDDIIHPRYYRGNGSVSCTEAAASMMNTGVHCIQPQADPDGKGKNIPPLGFYWWGLAFKHLWRWPYKGGVNDLKKCIQDIKELIVQVEEGER